MYQAPRNLFSVSSDYKTRKGERFGYLTAILYMAPERSVEGHNLCPMAGPAGCAQVCLNTAGRGNMNSVQRARLNRSQYFIEAQSKFVDQLVSEIESLKRRAARKNMELVVRLNGTSDILWERIRAQRAGQSYDNLMSAFPDIQFYDYTKRPGRCVPENYHLTFSYSEHTPEFRQIAEREHSQGRSIAVVFRNQVPSTWRDHRVVNGDETDLRFLDSAGSVIGLRAKGRARHDQLGLVVE